MTKATLTLATRVYDLDGCTNEVAIFYHERGVDALDAFNLDLATWQRMGEPRQITVAIEPGNALADDHERSS